MNKIDRRSFVQRTGLAGLSLLALNMGINRAKADPDTPQAAPANAPTLSADPEVYSFLLGGTEAHVILDGVLSFPGIQPAFAPEATKEQIDEELKRRFIPDSSLSLCVNVLVVKAKSGVMLFDAGAGKTFGPSAGRLLRGLAKIGVKPEDVKTIYVTHAHPDHIAGLVDDSNAPVFASAKIIAAKNEVSFWSADKPDVSGMRLDPKSLAGTLSTIQKFLTGMKPKLEQREFGKISDEVEMIAAPGHTPGHALFRITQGNEKLLVIGDAVHVWSLQFAHPEWTMIFDTNPTQAIATRRKLFKQVADERTMLLGYHMPFPGLGHVRATGEAFEWVAKPWA